jgi:hypothetical protein
MPRSSSSAASLLAYCCGIATLQHTLLISSSPRSFTPVSGNHVSLYHHLESTQRVLVCSQHRDDPVYLVLEVWSCACMVRHTTSCRAQTTCWSLRNGVLWSNVAGWTCCWLSMGKGKPWALFRRKPRRQKALFRPHFNLEVAPGAAPATLPPSVFLCAPLLQHRLVRGPGPSARTTIKVSRCSSHWWLCLLDWPV